jgi:hypothetical protein
MLSFERHRLVDRVVPGESRKVPKELKVFRKRQQIEFELSILKDLYNRSITNYFSYNESGCLLYMERSRSRWESQLRV